MKTSQAPKLAELTGPAGRLGEPATADRLPSWATYVRDRMAKWDDEYFGSSSSPWIWQADSHELIAMAEEGNNLPDALWRDVNRSRRAE